MENYLVHLVVPSLCSVRVQSMNHEINSLSALWRGVSQHKPNGTLDWVCLPKPLGAGPRPFAFGFTFGAARPAESSESLVESSESVGSEHDFDDLEGDDELEEDDESEEACSDPSPLRWDSSSSHG